MKKLRSIFPVLMLAILFVGIGSSAFAHEQSKLKNNTAIELPAQLKLEHKESYKVDDAEYVAWTVSKPNFPASRGFASVGIVAAFVIAITALFKPDKIAATMFTIALIAGAVGVAIGSPEMATGVLAAKIAPVAFKVNKEGVDKDSEEYKFLDGLEKRITVTGGATHEEVTQTIKTAIEESMKEVKGLDAEKINKLLDEKTGAMAILLKQGEELTKMRGMVVNGEKLTAKGLVRNEIKEFISKAENVEKLKSIYRQKAGQTVLFGSEDPMEAEKAVGNITTGSTSTNTGGNALLDLINSDEIASFNLRAPRVENFATVTRATKPVFVYSDYLPKEGDAGFTAEGGTKSQLDLKIETKYATPKKATGYEIMSQEAIEDLPRLQSEASTLLLKKYLMRRQNGILFGDGLNDTPVGVTDATIAQPFDENSWDIANHPVADPNLYDVIIAGANSIYSAHNYTDEEAYYPNVAFLNPKVVAGLKLKKNEFGMYLFPQLVLNGNDNKIDNLTIVAERDIPEGKILMGDFTKLRIINYVDYYVKMGWVNDQFIKNLFTMLGEGRFFTVVKNLDKKAFLYDDIATISEAIKANP